MDSLIGVPVHSGGFAIALVLGAVVSKTHFCAMGGISDWVNLRHTGRLGAWFLAIAVAIAGTTLLQALGTIDLSATRPPYRSANFAWPRYLLGGLMFGIGMTLAGGCVSKNLVRLGNGNLRALVTLGLVGVFAFLMTKTEFYAVLFHSWIAPLSIDLSRAGIDAQDVGSVLQAATGLVSVSGARTYAGLVIAVLLGALLLLRTDLRSHLNHWLGGIVVGLSVVAGWFLTAGPWGQQWWHAAEWLDTPPIGVGAQSYTFVNPLGEALTYAANPGDFGLITFGLLAALGVALGALAHALFAKQLRLEWFSSVADFTRHAVGGILMGIGGVLAMGCTIGQGISGVSTLAFGSVLALGAIILGSTTSMKIIYYRMLYQDASLLDAWLSSWVDLHLLPRRLRRLEAD